jgi:uncharacterized FlaG/YvyC family protein|tara:strand:- start:66 stop:287 length:222 start_codon:yes stop_codon:yes gene_type:complete
MNKLKVEGHPDLVRDTKSSAVINNSRRDYEEYMEQYRARKRSNDRIDNMESDMNNIREELNEIKHLLIKLTSG